MGRNVVFTSDAPAPPRTYSQAVKACGLVFVSGIGPFEAVTGKVLGETIEEQTRQCLTNIATILKAAGSSLEKIVSATIILRDESDFSSLNEEWVRWFPENPPARQGAKMPVQVANMKVSIAVIAEA